MKKLLDPRWLWIFHTLPVVLLFSILFGEFQVIKSLLEPGHIQLCLIFCSVLAGISTCITAYGMVQWKRGKETGVIYALLALAVLIGYLFAYGHYLDDMIPRNIPAWMLSDDIFLYMGTFLMPTMAHALFVLVVRSEPRKGKYSILLNFLYAAGIPLTWYLFGQIVLPLWQRVEFHYDVHVLLVLAVASTVLFLFFLLRSVYLLSIKKGEWLTRFRLLWQIPVALIFPVVGLLFNNGWFFDQSTPLFYSSFGILGNFSSPWFYLLAVVNGVLLCLPQFPEKTYRLLLMAARSTLLLYTFYFFLVLLPYLPLSVLAILLAGLGFLLLTPFILFILHVQLIAEDLRFLKQHFSQRLIYLIGLASLLVLPASITAIYCKDRIILHQALEYVYEPHLQEEVNIDTSSVNATLKMIKAQKNSGRNRWFDGPYKQPYLTTFYNWLVLDNMTLSDHKIRKMERIFNGTSPTKEFRSFRNPPGDSSILRIETIKTDSRYDALQQQWISTVEMEIGNRSSDSGLEYETTFELPAGCWIIDYYLYIEGRKEHGLLTEKKSALWVYNQIVNTRRDPGILYYEKGNQVTFRIFPFTAQEKRVTGLEFVHRVPVSWTIDGHVVQLGNLQSAQASSSTDWNKQVFYVSPKDKQQLPLVKRQPYYHFIVDLSDGKEKNKAGYIRQIQQLVDQNYIPSTQHRITFCNAYASAQLLNDQWKDNLQATDCKGGFFLERALQQLLTEQYLHPTGAYPLIVVLSDSLEQAVLEKDLTDYRFTYPDLDWFYVLKSHDYLEPHALFHDPLSIATDHDSHPFDSRNLKAWPSLQRPLAYLPDDEDGAVIWQNHLSEWNANAAPRKEWISGLYLQGKQMEHLLYPFLKNKEGKHVLAHSFASGIMTATTSFLAVENEAQKAMILKKQQEVMKGHSALDLEEEAQPMSEPGLLLLAAGMMLFHLYRTRKKHASLPLQSQQGK